VSQLLDGISTTDGVIVGGNVAWGNYQFSAPVRIATDSINLEASLVFRYIDDANFYWAGLGPYNHRVSICKYVGGTPSELAFAGLDTELVAGQTYELTVKVVGSVIELYVDGVLTLTVNDTSHPVGAVGFRSYNSHMEVDFADVVAICPTNYHWDTEQQGCIENVATDGYVHITAYQASIEVTALATINGQSHDTPHTFTVVAGTYNVTALFQGVTSNPQQVTVSIGETKYISVFFAATCPEGYHWNGTVCVQDPVTEPPELTGPLGIWKFPFITWIGTILPNVSTNAQSVLDNFKKRWERVSSNVPTK